jgi:hypothetical protein
MSEDFTCRNCGDYINEGTYCSKTCEMAYTEPAFARDLAASSGAGPFTAVQGTEKNQEFSTGAVRSETSGKGRFDLIPAYPIRRLAQHYENGARKYADRNWEKGLPLSRYIDSAERHMNAFKDGDRSEDHLAAILWNVAGYLWTERQIEMGALPDSLDDVPWEPSTGKVL